MAVRTAEKPKRQEEMRSIVRALDKCVKFMATASEKTLVDAIPKELIAGGRRDVFEAAIKRDRQALLPDSIAVRPDAAKRAEELLVFSGKIKKGQLNLDEVIDYSIVGGQSA